MEKIYIKIEEYLKKTFPQKKFVLNKDLKESGLTDIWGFNTIQIITLEIGHTVQYRPIFKK